MSTHDSSPQGGPGADAGVDLPGVVPFDLPRPTRLSWELGSRVVDDEEATLVGRWAHRESRWRLTVYRVTSATVVVRVRTPVGRERFYGAAESDLRSVLPAVEAASDWRRLD